MILAAGLSPAWQQIVLLEALHVGEVNRAREVHWCASGKVGNVAIALRHLCGVAGGSSTEDACRILTLCGGAAGDSLKREISEWNLASRWIAAVAPTRVCTTLLDRQKGTTTEIVENAGGILADELSAFRTAFAAEAGIAGMIVLTGSFPAGVPVDLYKELLAISPPTTRSIVDAQGESLLAACSARPFLVKPNREELGRTLGRTLESESDVWQAMDELRQRGAQEVLVTEGSGPVRLSFGSQRFQFTLVPIAVVNPIGSGDCLAAGMAWALDQGRDLPEAVRIGVSAAAENALQLLPARLDRDAVLQRAKDIAVRELA